MICRFSLFFLFSRSFILLLLSLLTTFISFELLLIPLLPSSDPYAPYLSISLFSLLLTTFTSLALFTLFTLLVAVFSVNFYSLTTFSDSMVFLGVHLNLRLILKPFDIAFLRISSFALICSRLFPCSCCTILQLFGPSLSRFMID